MIYSVPVGAPPVHFISWSVNMCNSNPPESALRELIDISETLLGPGGCPWDRSREPGDLKTTILEEAHEVIDAIKRDEPDDLEEELGDLLYQILFFTKIYDGPVSLTGVIEHISNKLVRRHPHVFGEDDAESPEEGVSNWEEIKRQERESDETDDRFESESVVLSGVPPTLPALLKAYRFTQKAASAGFDWTDREPAFAKVREELDELAEAADRDDPEEAHTELGDLLFACAGLARKLDVDPEQALQDGNDKFRMRFSAMERKLRDDGRTLKDADRDELITLWEQGADDR